MFGLSEFGQGNGGPQIVVNTDVLQTQRNTMTESSSDEGFGGTTHQLDSGPDPSFFFNCCFTMRPILPKSPTNELLPVGSSGQQGPKSTVVLPRLGKRKQNTEAGKEKITSVRRAGACLRCRIYKESVSRCCCMSLGVRRASLTCSSVTKTHPVADASPSRIQQRFSGNPAPGSLSIMSSPSVQAMPEPERSAQKPWFRDGRLRISLFGM
jgi:hypothetical protein